MGKYLERTSGKTTISLPTEGQSSTIPEPADAPVFKRLEVALQYMVSKGNGLQNKQMTMRIITKIMREALEDMYSSGLHPDIASMYMKQLAAMIYWVSDGSWNTEIPMPEDFKLDCGTALRDRNLTEE
jgi:hypothetical protein